MIDSRVKRQMPKKDPGKEFPPNDLLKQVNEICVAVDGVRDAQELLEVSLKNTIDLFGASRGSIFLLGDKDNELVLQTACGMKIDEQKRMVKRLGQGVVGKVAEIKKPLFVDDISKDDRFQNYKSRSSYRTPSFICAPLLIKDKLIGVINITDKKSGHRFTEDEMLLLDFVASQIALNYRRIQLYQKFKNIVKESQVLKDQLGKRSEEANQLKEQIVIHEKLASIGKLAGGIAHEFNNPLDGVIRYTNLSLEYLKEDNDVVRGYLLEIKQGLNRMAKIVRSLLACSRNAQPTMQAVDINQTIEQSIAGVRSEIFHKNISVEKKLAEPLPTILDLGVDQIISNILRNAIDAVDRDGKIKIVTVQHDSHICISISDSGCGIPQENINTIFEPFFTTKEMEKGCGLGLTIVNEIVKAYSGTIEIQSVLKKGTTFTITLPIRY